MGRPNSNDCGRSLNMSFSSVAYSTVLRPHPQPCRALHPELFPMSGIRWRTCLCGCLRGSVRCYWVYLREHRDSSSSSIRSLCTSVEPKMRDEGGRRQRQRSFDFAQDDRPGERWYGSWRPSVGADGAVGRPAPNGRGGEHVRRSQIEFLPKEDILPIYRNPIHFAGQRVWGGV